MHRAIVAVTWPGLGIGFEGKIPWDLSADRKHFRSMTMGQIVIMGSKTWKSLGRPLKDRHIIVLTHDPTLLDPKAKIVATNDTSVRFTNDLDKIPTGGCFIAGGAEIYRLFMECTDTIYLTRVLTTKFKCDCVFDNVLDKFTVSHEGPVLVECQIRYQFVTYERKLPLTIMPPSIRNERNYLSLVDEILQVGTAREDRTGVGTIGIFGSMTRYVLSEPSMGGVGRRLVLPLLTTKRMFWKGIVEELLWFIRGETDANTLAAKGVHIWDANAADYAKKHPLVPQGTAPLGPVYGFQWRHFGAEYQGTEIAKYVGKGFDQLAWVINELKTNPTSRRIIMTAWNPPAIAQMALPPCHVLCHFLTEPTVPYLPCERKEDDATRPALRLVCILYQRSGDMGLGVPFNIASYALLTHMIAAMLGYVPHELVHMIGDTHIYKNHVDALNEQCTRVTHPAPTLVIKRIHERIEQFAAEDFKLLDYHPEPAIEMQMAL